MGGKEMSGKESEWCDQFNGKGWGGNDWQKIFGSGTLFGARNTLECLVIGIRKPGILLERKWVLRANGFITWEAQ